MAFFFKQWGGRTSKAGGRLLDDWTYDAMPSPSDRRHRELALTGVDPFCGPTRPINLP